MIKIGTIVVVKQSTGGTVRFLTTIPPATMVKFLRSAMGRGAVLVGMIGAEFGRGITLITSRHIESWAVIRDTVKATIVVECDDSLVRYDERHPDGFTLEARLGDQID